MKRSLLTYRHLLFTSQIIIFILFSIYICPCSVRHGQRSLKKPWQQGKTAPIILQMKKSKKG